MAKTALVTGVTGQDGSYLAEHLLHEGYEVHGLVRRTSTDSMKNLNIALKHKQFHVVAGELDDPSLLSGLIAAHKYDEVYNLGAMSFVRHSFDNPIQAARVNYLGCVTLIEAIRHHSPDTRYYQASTSEMYGGIQQEAYSEQSYFYPRSPYGVAKLAAYWHTRNARDGYGLFACNGILFNHSGPRRGPEFVTQKVAMAAKEYQRICQSHGYAKGFMLEMGNMDALRDWGDSRDFIRGMHLMLQQDFPDDYVLATGETHSVREMTEFLFELAGTKIRWTGRGLNEVGINDDDNVIIRINPAHYRPTEVGVLLGDAAKARSQLGWQREISFKQMLTDMFNSV
jgi:GDPmannose 4,6-dehydratase